MRYHGHTPARRNRSTRWNAIERELQAEAAARRRFWHNVFVIKGAIMVGLVAAYFLPPTHKEYALIATNLLWLWKT